MSNTQVSYLLHMKPTTQCSNIRRGRMSNTLTPPMTTYSKVRLSKLTNR